MDTPIGELISANQLFIIVIDNPHLCLGRRVHSLLERIVENSDANQIVIAGNWPENFHCPSNCRVIPFQPHRYIEDEKEFYNSFLSFAEVDIFRDIKMPISNLDLFDATGFDSLIFAYRASYEIEASLPEDLTSTYDKVIILGSSHFNYPFPEKILGELKSKNLISPETPIIGVPVGPVSGPLTPHWCFACDYILVRTQKMLDVLKRMDPTIKGQVLPQLFVDIPKSFSTQNATTDQIRVFVDWTFIHNWQLKNLLRELIASEAKNKIKLYLSAVSEETSQMLWRKWHHLLEELNPEWIIIGSDDYYRAIEEMEIVVGFVFGRDVWVWRKDKGNVLICDFAGWWQVFGFEGPTPPIATARQLVHSIEQIVYSVQEP